MKILMSGAIAAIIALSLIPKAEAAVLTLTDQFIIAGDGTVVPIGGDAATEFNSRGPTSGEPWEYAVRERGNTTQGDRRVATFLQFDTSSVTAADVNNPNFSAVFSLQHIGHLNDLNPGMDVGIGQVVSGLWDDDGGPTPDFTWALDNSINQSTVLENVNHLPGVAAISYDATAFVQDWVLNGTNQGIALFGYEDGGGGNPTNGSYLNNASLDWEIVPEPSSSLLALLGVSALLFRRRR